MNATPPSADAVKVARDAFRLPNAPEGRLITFALGVMKLRTLSDWPYSRTRLLLQAAHQANTGT